MSERRAVGSVVLALLVAVCGCGGEDAAGPRSPRDLRLAEEVYDELTVSWAPASDVRESIIIELSFAGSPFQFRGEFPGAAGSTDVPLTSASPELTSLQVRARTARPTSDGKGTELSDWTVASLQRGIRPPTITATRGSVDGATAIHVAWTARSSVADALSFERIETPIGGSAPDVTRLPVSPDARSFDDVELRAPRFYRYRVRAGRAGVWSAPAESNEVLISAITPWRIAAEHVPGGVRVSWTPILDTTLAQYLEGKPARVPAITASVASWTDTRFPAWPTQSYRLSISGLDALGDDAQVLSEWIRIPPFTFEGAGQRYSAFALDVPAPPAARAPDGTWWLGSGETLQRQTATGWESSTVTGRFGSDLLFAGNTPHRIGIDSSDSYLVHEWWSGAPTWSREEVPTPSRTVSPSDLTFALGPDGALHVVYAQSKLSNTARIVHVTRRGGEWSPETLPTPAGMSVKRFLAAVAADGTVYAAVEPDIGILYTGGFVLCSRPPAGPWSCIPTDVNGQLLGVFAMRDGPVAVLQRAVGGEGQLTAVSFQAVGWTTRSARSTTDPRALAVSPDGSTIAVLAFDYDPAAYRNRPLRLATFDGSAWSDRIIAPSVEMSYPAALRVGFVGNRVWATCSEYSTGVSAWEQQ